MVQKKKYRLIKGPPHDLRINGIRHRYHVGDVLVPRQKDLDRWPHRFELVKEENKIKNEEDKEIEELLDEYYTDGGWYKLPGMEKGVRKKEAIKILQEKVMESG